MAAEQARAQEARASAQEARAERDWAPGGVAAAFVDELFEQALGVAVGAAVSAVGADPSSPRRGATQLAEERAGLVGGGGPVEQDGVEEF